MIDFALDKEQLRKAARQERKRMTQEQRDIADKSIFTQVTSLPKVQRAACVLAYASFGSEVDTWCIIDWCLERGIGVCLPYCVPQTRTMRWFVYEGRGSLVESPYGILEPDPDSATEYLVGSSFQEVALVPGLVFDDQGFRVGYGGGFYDVFLESFKGYSVGLCRKGFYSNESVCADHHDVPVDYVVVSE